MSSYFFVLKVFLRMISVRFKKIVPENFFLLAPLNPSPTTLLSTAQQLAFSVLSECFVYISSRIFMSLCFAI